MSQLPNVAPDARPRAAFLGSILAIQLAFWSLALYTAPTYVPQRQLIAEGFSTFAIVLMSTNLILSTRVGFLERRLDGLDKLFVTHRTIGLSVALLVIAHYALVPKSIGYVASKPVGYTTIALLLVAIFMASAPRFPWRRLVTLKYQTWKFSHRFMGALVALAVTHSLLAPTYVRGVPLLAGYVYGVAALGLLAWLYRELLFPRTGPFRNGKVGHSRLLGESTIEIVLSSGPASLRRAPGQFAFVSFGDGPTHEQHPFTISSGTQDDIRFSIRAAGDFTEKLLAGVPVGSDVRVEGPYGAFTNARGREHRLWLAGGIGITPFLSMSEDLDQTARILLVWSVTHGREAIYADELSRSARAKPNLDFLLHETSAQGHLDLASLRLEADPREYSAFICGPLPMRREFLRQLKAMGVSRSEIFFEEFRLR